MVCPASSIRRGLSLQSPGVSAGSRGSAEPVVLTDCLLGLGTGGLATWRNMLCFGHTPGRDLVLPSAVSGSEVEVDGSYLSAPAAMGSVRLSCLPSSS